MRVRVCVLCFRFVSLCFVVLCGVFGVVLHYAWCCVIVLWCDVIMLHELLSCDAWKTVPARTRIQCHAIPERILTYSSISCNCRKYCHGTAYCKRLYAIFRPASMHHCNPMQCKIAIRQCNEVNVFECIQCNLCTMLINGHRTDLLA